MSNIIWIDPNIEGNEENQSYLNELQTKVTNNVVTFKTVKEGIDQINTILFEELIISFNSFSVSIFSILLLQKKRTTKFSFLIFN